MSKKNLHPDQQNADQSNSSEPAADKVKEQVGYKQPPKKSQFQKGKSGNANGRPKGAKNLKTIVIDTLLKSVDVREGGQVKRMTNIEVVLHSAVKQSTKGDMKAASLIMQACKDFNVEENSAKNTNFPRGGIMVVPGIASVDEWEAVAIPHQKKLVEDTMGPPESSASLGTQPGSSNPSVPPEALHLFPPKEGEK